MSRVITEPSIPMRGPGAPGSFATCSRSRIFPSPLTTRPNSRSPPDRVGNGTEDERGDGGVKDAFAKLEGLYISQVELDGKAQPPGPLPGRGQHLLGDVDAREGHAGGIPGKILSRPHTHLEHASAGLGEKPLPPGPEGALVQDLDEIVEHCDPVVVLSCGFPFAICRSDSLRHGNVSPRRIKSLNDSCIPVVMV